MKKRAGRPRRPTIEGVRASHVRTKVLDLVLRSAVTVEELALLLERMRTSAGLSRSSVIADLKLRALLDLETRAEVAFAPIDAERAMLYEIAYDRLTRVPDAPLRRAADAAEQALIQSSPSLRTQAKEKRPPEHQIGRNKRAYMKRASDFKGASQDLIDSLEDAALEWIVPSYARSKLFVYLTTLHDESIRLFRATVKSERKAWLERLEASLARAPRTPGYDAPVLRRNALLRLGPVADLYGRTARTIINLRYKINAESDKPLTVKEWIVKRGPGAEDLTAASFDHLPRRTRRR